MIGLLIDIVGNKLSTINYFLILYNMKIIFLDIDGVLIPLYRRDHSLKKMNWILADIPKEVSDNLVRVLQDPSVFIVISSSWRHYWPNCKKLLEQIPINDRWDTVWDRVISKTWYASEGWRSTEILMWLNEYHRTAKYWYHITHWVAIDDEFYDMKAIRRVGKLIKTEGGIGLTSEHAEEIISLLNH